MKVFCWSLLFCSFITGCSLPKEEISDELYTKALLYLVFEDAPIGTFYESNGCVFIDSSNFCFNEDRFGYSKFWDGASIYKMGDTIGYFGGSCIFMTNVYILNRSKNQIICYEGREFYGENHKTLSSKSLASFKVTDTLSTFSLKMANGKLEVYNDDKSEKSMEIISTPQKEKVIRFNYWSDKETPMETIVYELTRDSLIRLDMQGSTRKELIVLKSDRVVTWCNQLKIPLFSYR